MADNAAADNNIKDNADVYDCGLDNKSEDGGSAEEDTGRNNNQTETETYFTFKGAGHCSFP